MTHKVHESLPSGFHFADRLQVDSFVETGSVPGASKVCLVAGAGELPRLATRLRPPFDWPDAMVLAYKAGWRDARGVSDADIQPSAYWLGWRDAKERRMKWHLAHCPDHGDHDGGCHA